MRGRGMLRVVAVAMIAATVLTAGAQQASVAEPTDQSAVSGGRGGQARVIGAREVEARAFDWSSFRAPHASTRSDAPCRYEGLAAAEFASYFDHVVRASVPFGARFYRVTCDGGTTWDYGWWVPSRAQSINGAFGDVIQEAIDRLRPRRPQIMLSPPVHVRHVVGIPTWLAVDAAGWSRQSMNVTAGEVAVEVTVTPVAARWWIGDGGVVRCWGPGSIFDSSVALTAQFPECHHTFVVPSPGARENAGEGWPIRVEIEYSARAIIRTPVGTGATPLGEVLGPPATVMIAVDEVQAVRTGR